MPNNNDYPLTQNGEKVQQLLDAIQPPVGTAQPSGGFLPNKLYNLGELSDDTTFALAAPSDNTIVNHYYFTFETGATAPTITWPTGIVWMGGEAPEIAENSHYEISILNGIAAYMEVELPEPEEEEGE